MKGYENSRLYKERTKKFHDAKICQGKQFKEGDHVFLYNSRLRLFLGKLKSRLFGQFTVTQVFLYGTVEVTHPEKGTFKVNGHKLKLYVEGDPDKLNQEEFTLHWVEK